MIHQPHNNEMLNHWHTAMYKARRIALVGMPGSGKSTIAIYLKKSLQLPLFHLDLYYWKPGWQKGDLDQFCQQHAELIQQDEWIIDGVYGQTYKSRFDRADIIIFLDLPWRICAWRVIKRMIQSYGKRRSTNVPEGCLEGIDFNFLSYVWHWPHDHRVRLLNTLQEYPKKTWYIKSNKEVKELLKVLSFL